MFNLKSRFSIIEIIPLVLIAVMVILAVRFQSLRTQEHVLVTKINNETTTETEMESLKKDKKEVYRKLNQIFHIFYKLGFDGDSGKVNPVGIFPLLIYVMLTHQVVLFFI